MEDEKGKIENEDDVAEDYDFDHVRNDYQIESEAEIK
jgi:hypothetical protein